MTSFSLSDGISQIMHGNDDFGSKCTLEKTKDIAGCKIDQTLTTAQAVMGFINQIDTVDDLVLESQAARAKMFAGIGSAGPAVVAGTMLIMFRIAMALFIGFAPIFILCLLFKRTAPLFQKWLYYGLATLFSSVLLGVMADISSDLVRHIATGLFVSNNLLNFVTGSNASGVMQAATQQLGLGLILSTLLIIVPPMAGAFFNGVMGQYYGSNYLGAGMGGAAAYAGSGAGSGVTSINSHIVSAQQHETLNTNTTPTQNNNYHLRTSSSTTSDDVKTNTASQVLQPNYSRTITDKVIAENSDKTKPSKGEQV